MGEFSLTHWLIILVIILIFVGPSKLPGLGKGLGEAIRGFKKGLNTDEPPADVNDPNRQLNQSTERTADKTSAHADQRSVKKDEKV
jgi:sec-independent protein translocase protein TatA